jgi:hypothetical protein
MISEMEDRKFPTFEAEEDRQFSFSSAAENLSIPRESWNEPFVKQYVNLHNQMLELQQNLTVASSSVQPGWRERSAEEQLHEWEGTAGMDPTLSERYSASENLLRAALAIMSDGLGTTPDPDPTNYIRSKAQVGLGLYGLKVEANPDSWRARHKRSPLTASTTRESVQKGD